jgi:hypothetical protein
MDHILILRHTDIIEYATKLLAMRGVKPATPIVFKSRKGHPGEFEAYIECESTDLPDHCPQCGARLGQGPMLTYAANPASVPPTALPSPDVTAVPIKPVEPPIQLDGALGESFDPPGATESFARGEASQGDAGNMAALVAASRKLEQDLERERNRRPKK